MIVFKKGFGESKVCVQAEASLSRGAGRSVLPLSGEEDRCLD